MNSMYVNVHLYEQNVNVHTYMDSMSNIHLVIGQFNGQVICDFLSNNKLIQ